MLEKSVHDLLFLTHKFLALLQAGRLALDVDYSAVMQDTIQDGGGDGDIGKDLVPLSSMMSILYLARTLSLSGRRFSKWAFLSCSMSWWQLM